MKLLLITAIEGFETEVKTILNPFRSEGLFIPICKRIQKQRKGT